MSDEDLRELERRAALDGAQGLRFARALARSGDVPRAARELVRILEQRPDEADALVELDRLTRGGVDPTSPWPGARGDGRHSGRSTVAGPVRGGQAGRVSLDVTRVRRGLAVDGRGRVLLVADPGQGGMSLLAAGAEGGLEKLAPTSAEMPVCLAGFHVVHSSAGSDGGLILFALAPGGVGGTTVRHPWIAGLGHVVFAKTLQRVEARQLPTQAAPLRWAAPVPRRSAAIAFGPGALVLVLSSSGLGARGSFHRFELATGRALPAISLERLGTVDGNIIAAADGTTFLGLGGGTLALDAAGREMWRHERSGFPAALAGERADVLVVCDHGTYMPRALDARTGAELWSARDACLNGLPKVDATGRIFWRREEELVAFDPRTGAVVYQALVAKGMWDFAFDGRGRALALCYSPAAVIVLE